MDSQFSTAVPDVLIRFLDDFLQLYLQPCPNQWSCPFYPEPTLLLASYRHMPQICQKFCRAASAKNFMLIHCARETRAHTLDRVDDKIRRHKVFLNRLPLGARSHSKVLLHHEMEMVRAHFSERM